MSNVKFHRKKDGLILLSYTPAPYQRYRISTGLHCPASEWNKKRQRATGSGRFQGNAGINALLDRLQAVATNLDAETRLHYQRPPTREELRAAVYQATGRDAGKEHETTLMGFPRLPAELVIYSWALPASGFWARPAVFSIFMSRMCAPQVGQ